MTDNYVAYDGPLVTRRFAKENALPRYFTGKPCKHGHISERIIGNSGCCACHKIVSLAYCHKSKEKTRKYYEANKAKISDYQQEYRKQNAKSLAEYNKNWRRQKPWKYREAGAKRRALKMQATPPWANTEAISEIYLNCPDGYHVDHYYPLSHKNFCGLHVENNLRIIPAMENMRKNNKSPEEFYGELHPLI